ncbi:acyltransferase [Hyphomicrobium sp. ghe19]|uniref:acyltransferase family protein n=1 Tax=Hyphomicrobium sp. ghe19 TaxID=2682968 RepID=UPI0030CED437
MIDVLRGFAATFVVVYHVMHYFPLPGAPAGGPRWVQYGWTGVDLFFVISGFVISLSAFRGIDRLGSTGFRMDFARQRLARIAPLYYLTGFIFAVTLVPALFFETNAWMNWLAHALFAHNLFPKFHGSIDGANWSVGTEMQFYLLILLAAPWLRSAKSITIVIIFIAISWAWRLTSYFYFAPEVSPASFGMFFFQTQLPGMLDEFAIGILVAKLIRSPSDSASQHLAMGALLLAVSIVGIAAVTLAANPLVHYLFFRTFLASGFGALLLLACHLSGTILMAASLPFRYIGKISYGIYLWHLVVLVPMMQFKWLTADRALPVILGSTALLAAVSWHFFERPFLMRYGRRSYQTEPLTEPKTDPLSDERELPSPGLGFKAPAAN